ncbi:MAG: hypothetical protein AAFP81_19840 [Pseudomonadota bacterium]
MSIHRIEYGGRQQGKALKRAIEEYGQAIDDALINAINERIGTGWSIKELGSRFKRLERQRDTGIEQWFLDGELLLWTEMKSINGTIQVSINHP